MSRFRNSWFAAHPWIVLIVVGVLAAFVAPLAFSSYQTRQTATRRFTIEEDFTKVRKILVRTDGAKQIVTMAGDSEFVDQKWSAGGAELDSLKLLDPQWRLELHGTLRVRTKDEYVGEHEIALDQQVEIEPDFLDSRVKMKEPSERLKDYAMHTRFDRAAGEQETNDAGAEQEEAAAVTQVELQLSQEILTHAPWFAHGVADRRVKASAERALANQETAIRQLIEKNRDKNWLFPLK
jgi:hypothetical protein